MWKLDCLQATIRKDEEDEYNMCIYDSDISTGYGLGAFFLLMASQILIMVASRCFCCGKALNPTGSRACAVILFIFCWYVDVAHKFDSSSYELIKKRIKKVGGSMQTD